MAIAAATRTAIFQRITEATPSPLEDHEGDRLAGQVEAQRGLSFLDAQRGWALDRREPACAQELRILLGVRRDRRAHSLPERVGVAVALVDSVVRQARLAGCERQPTHRESASP